MWPAVAFRGVAAMFVALVVTSLWVASVRVGPVEETAASAQDGQPSTTVVPATASSPAPARAATDRRPAGPGRPTTDPRSTGWVPAGHGVASGHDGWGAVAALLGEGARSTGLGTAAAAPTAVGLLTFRGGPRRDHHGTGPVPDHPVVAWRAPARAMCATSRVGEEVREWCGTGWTGQPAVVVREGRTWLVVGAYDRAIHFLDAETGDPLLPAFPTGDIIKGSVTIDPDGHPIVYSGSRDGRYRAIAFDGDAPRELWSLSNADATGPTRWNDDWDGSGLVVDGHLLIGGENSRLFVVRLNRSTGADGLVQMAPEVVWDVAGFDDQLLADIRDGNVSIEGSVAFHDGVVYLANSGGLVQGWDLRDLLAGGDGEPTRVLRFWTGDDTDATVVIGPDGMLYVASEWERFNDRASDVGQVMKLDPSRPDDPLVWSFHDPRAVPGTVAGVWATPALHRDVLIVPTTGGTLYGLSVRDGTVRWEVELGDHLWSSPVVVDDLLLQGDCRGRLHAFDLGSGGGDDNQPVPRWTIDLAGCIESTPAVWDGRIHVGTRAGQVWTIADEGR